jgi:hypothetical protein
MRRCIQKWSASGKPGRFSIISKVVAIAVDMVGLMVVVSVLFNVATYEGSGIDSLFITFLSSVHGRDSNDKQSTHFVSETTTRTVRNT